MKEKQPQFSHECVRCERKWESRAEFPETCPSCRTRKWHISDFNTTFLWTERQKRPDSERVV